MLKKLGGIMATILENEGLTFDDVLLLPAASEVLPTTADVSSKLSDTITLSTPIISAAMDTVTESEMAIKMALSGGIGVVHKNLSIEDQAAEVKRVKTYVNGFITEPTTASKDMTLATAKEIMNQSGISGLPVVDEENKLIGILSKRDLKYVENFEDTVESKMTHNPKVIKEDEVSVDYVKELLRDNRIEKLPIVDDNGILKGYITSRDIDNYIEYTDATKDAQGRLSCAAAIGVSVGMDERIEALVDAGVDMLVLDSAHGHSKGIVDAVRRVRELAPDVVLVAGNIVTKEAAADLYDAGADIVKVGIGPGSICTTRIITGVGRPQITAIMEVAEYAHSIGKKVIGDGGIKYSGDIAKALAAGADAVMLGSMLAGCKESPGEEILYQGKRYKRYVGMGSIEAMKRGSSDRYFQKDKREKKLISEGVGGQVMYKGLVEDVVYQLIGGVKSSFGYCGCASMEEFQTKTRFQKISSSTLVENHPHSITITNEQPNYQK